MKGFRLIKKIAQNKQGRIGLIILLVLAVTAVFAPLIAPFDPYDVTMRDAKGLAPDKINWLGATITTGQDGSTKTERACRLASVLLPG